jgi:cold shock CspA family protein
LVASSGSNNKSGFGFLTVCEGDHKDKDIFVHFSSIRGESQQYKYLVQGEYVEFKLIKSDSENHKFHASDVSGMKEGILMCDTHRLNNSYSSSNIMLAGEVTAATIATIRAIILHVLRIAVGLPMVRDSPK